MLIISPATAKLLLAVPVNPYATKWHAAVHAFYAAMGAELPDWQDGVKVVPNDGTDECSVLQWHANIDHMVEQGIKLEVANCSSYWFLRRSTSTWVGHGKHTVLELCYVSAYHDEFHGHATEYFPSLYTLDAFNAMLHRMATDKTTKDSGMGMDLAGAIALNSVPE